MTQILTSIHGRKLGLSAGGKLLCPSGFIAGEHGSQFHMPSPSKIQFFDDFLGDVIADQWNPVEGTDSATSDAAILPGGMGGVLRMTTGDAGTGLAADLEQLTQALQWQASNGALTFQTRLKLSAITNAYVFLGLTDNASLEGPIISAGAADTLTTNATDAVGFMFDTRMATDNWWLTGVANDVDAVAQNSGFAPVVDTYAVFRVEVDKNGIATFYYNGKHVGTAMAGAVTPGADLTPTLAVSKTSVAASMTMDVDYVEVSMDR